MPSPMPTNPVPAPHQVLVVCTQRIGDVLLTTPLVRSLKQHWPLCEVDVLVLPGTQGALEGNPDIRQVRVFAPRVPLREKLAQLRSLWRKYDLALSTIASDRARLFAWAAAPRTVGFVAPDESHPALKRKWLAHAVPFDNMHTHTVAMNLQLLLPLGVPPCTQVVNPQSPDRPLPPALQQLLDSKSPFAVLHPNPKFPYKMWTTEGWKALGQWLQGQNIRIVLTASPDPQESAYVGEVAQLMGGDCLNASGQLTLGQTADLLAQARLFVGPDTAVTHMAAASGCPTVALFGPSNPMKWAPWPARQPMAASPWQRSGSQQQGNVWLIQGKDSRGCVPCMLEGCDRHEQSRSRCLDQVLSASVIRAVSQAMQINDPA
jgi:heptosyltransferase III